MKSRRTKVDDIKDLGAAILCYTSEKLTICTGRDTNDRCKMGAVMFDELNADVLLLPELEMSINRCSNQEIRSVQDRKSIYDRERHRAYLVATQKLTTSRCIKLL